MKSVRPDGSTTVTAFLAGLEHPLKAEIEAIRALILGVDARVREEVKWNAPSFYITEHFATLRLHPVNTVQIVFHVGAKKKAELTAIRIDDPSGLLQWPAADRCVAKVFNVGDFESKRAALTQIIKQWIESTQ